MDDLLIRVWVRSRLDSDLPRLFTSPATMVNFDLITGCNMQKARRVKAGRLAKLHLRTA